MTTETATVETPAPLAEPTDAHRRCSHRPPCPPAHGCDRSAARVVAAHPEQGWSLLCNGVVLFEDTGELLPDRAVVSPHLNRLMCVGGGS